jgi:hypothetical protein
MSDAPVVWLEQGEIRDDAVRALDEWARTRGVRLGVLEERAPAAPASDPSAGESIEKELERARLAIGAADPDTADRALARAERVLREHPALPQGAWLRAEVERAWSARWLRLEPRDEMRARVAWENAQALDGGRVPGVGETAFPPRPLVPVNIVVPIGANNTLLTVRLDTTPLKPTSERGPDALYRVDVAPGEHVLVATLGDDVVFASWIAIPAPSGKSPTPARITVEVGGSCSRERLALVRRRDGQIDAAGVSCPQWIAAVPGERRGSVLVARCEQGTCGPLLEWRTEQLPASFTPQTHGKLAGWPGWATWTLVGIGAATAASVALIATGVFETRPVEPRFVVGGARQE